jgi:AcrR family transcriptional regulator
MAKEPGAGPARRASDRGRYSKLNRERVLAAALELVDHEGLAALSMRRLGAELGVEARALYRYAPSKDALLDGLVEVIYLEWEDRLARGSAPKTGRAASPATEEPEWRAELHRIALTTYQVCSAHPQVVPLLTARMLAVPLARRPLAVLQNHERVLAMLKRTGLDENCTTAAFRAFTAWVLGFASMELQAMVDNPEETDPAFRFGLHRMPPHELPRLRETAVALTAQSGPDGLAIGLDALLDRFTRPEAEREHLR